MFTLDRVVPWGRSFDEYRPMFAYQVTIERVPYEFQRGGNEMLRVRRPG
jgi:hypothetical protein